MEGETIFILYPHYSLLVTMGWDWVEVIMTPVTGGGGGQVSGCL